LGLSGCGRAGPLESPPGPATPSAQLSSDRTPVPGSPQDTAMRTGFDAQGNPVATTGQKRPFILDPLLQ
jgi:predicted small lipoprotein YifL